MSAEASVRQALEDAGYSFIQAEPRLARISPSFQPDILAWAADSYGRLVPWAVVEIKSRPAKLPPEVALPQLAKSRDVLGTVDHYVVQHGDWYRADAGFRKVMRVDGPIPPKYGGEGELDDVDLATSLLTEQLWHWAETRSRHAHAADSDALSTDLSIDGIETSSGAVLPASREVLWEARRRALVGFARRGPEPDIYTSYPVIAKAVARLAGNKLDSEVLDPFCGTGSFLWESIDHSREIGSGLLSAIGFDANYRMVELARSIARAAPIDVEISQADAFDDELSLGAESLDLVESPLVNCVVSAPPIGLRLHLAYELLDGTLIREGDFATVDRLVRRLADGGRAVLQVAPGFTFRRSGERYRNYLANHYRVAALIGCPPGSVPGWGLASIIMVIEKAPPTETFIAQLGEDWESQLAPGGSALEAALTHINSRSDHQ
jgi:hypothetical protein